MNLFFVTFIFIIFYIFVLGNKRKKLNCIFLPRFKYMGLTLCISFFGPNFISGISTRRTKIIHLDFAWRRLCAVKRVLQPSYQMIAERATVQSIKLSSQDIFIFSDYINMYSVRWNGLFQRYASGYSLICQYLQVC